MTNKILDRIFMLEGKKIVAVRTNRAESLEFCTSRICAMRDGKLYCKRNTFKELTGFSCHTFRENDNCYYFKELK